MIPDSCQTECDYLKKALDMLNRAGLDRNHLAGIKVWIGASKRDKTSIQMRRLYSCVLSKLGVNIIDIDFEAILAGRVEYDVLLMFTFTPGTSARAIEIVVNQHSKKSTVKDKLCVYMPKEYSDGYISRKLEEHLKAVKVYYKEKLQFQQLDKDIFAKCIKQLIEIVNDMKNEKKYTFKPKILIVTALPLEFEMMVAFLEDKRYDLSFGDVHTQYPHGKINKQDVVVAMSSVGNNFSAAITTKILEKYPSIKYIFMIGIAGGIPNLENKNEHIRLGDIVVCNQFGVKQHDMGKNEVTPKGAEFQYTYLPRPPNATLLTNTHMIVTNTGMGNYKYWEYLDWLLSKKKITRPKKMNLCDSDWISDFKKRQPSVQKGYNKERPRIHFGVIASGNTVVKDADVRDELKNKLKAKAIEMEASGVSDAAWLQGKDYFIVRGICDYANADKNKIWQPYAAAVAAAFTREIIETLSGD
jgi:nucleoside phosphorylase